jgi:hypothetical protein
VRDFINAILTFINASTLTDEEYDAIDVESFGYDSDTYTLILGILDAREVVSSTRDRLTYYFQAKGVEVSAPSSGRSNILIGGDLCGD